MGESAVGFPAERPSEVRASPVITFAQTSIEQFDEETVLVCTVYEAAVRSDGKAEAIFDVRCLLNDQDSFKQIQRLVNRFGTPLRAVWGLPFYALDVLAT